MDLVTPDIGLIFWSTLFFLILLFVLGRFAWPAILTAVHTRNDSIKKALEAAEKAKEEMAQLKADNEKIIAEARQERDSMIREAMELKEEVIIEAREKALRESHEIIQHARQSIEKEKQAAINDMKTQMATLSVHIAEKLLREKLGDGKAHKELVSKLIDEAELN